MNYSNLIIEAEENSEVIAPVSGTIKTFHYAYYKRLNISMTFGGHNYKDSISINDYDNYFRETIARENNLRPEDISLLLGIETRKDEIYWLLGLRPTKYFKTGTKITKGETIGKVGYSYGQIKEPSIIFSRDIGGRPADPMIIFGLKSTFDIVPEKKINYETYKHHQTKLLQDFKIFKNSLIQGHPGLYDYIEKSELNKCFNKAEMKLNKPMTTDEFKKVLLPIVKNIRDSHTVLLSKTHKSNEDKYPPILYGLRNDSLLIFASLPKFNNFLGKRIVEIDGKKVSNIIPMVKKMVYGSDGNIKTLEERWLLLYFWDYYHKLYKKGNSNRLNIKFDDGNEYSFSYQKRNLDDFSPYFIKKETDRFSLSILSSQTALLDINTFNLLEKDIDSIGNFIKKINTLKISNLIIDVRDNLGGSTENINKIFSFIAFKPFKSILYQKVNSNSVYPFLKHSLNIPKDEYLFPNYIKQSDRDGYFLLEGNFPETVPNKNNHFNKNIYVLINELSRSAATIFPALVYREKNGTIVGRETGSTYFQLNALKFADIYLENTGLELRMPLVKVVFDEQKNTDIPWGRGVLPDYNIPITYDEFLSDKDLILDATLDLISNPKNSYENEQRQSNYLLYFILSSAIMILIAIYIKRYLV